MQRAGKEGQRVTQATGTGQEGSGIGHDIEHGMLK